MGRSGQLSVITPVSRPALLPLIAPTVPPGAEWVLVTDGPQDVPAGLRPHVLVEGPSTRSWGDVQRQIGLEAATRPFVYFLDDDNLMLPMVADLVIPILEESGAPGAVFAVLLRHPSGFYVWPPPTRIERSQVDTAMFLGRTDAARRVGWPDMAADGVAHGLEGQRCGDFVFLRDFDEAAGLLRLPILCGFHDGVGVIRHFEPAIHASLERDALDPQALLGVLHRHMGQADAPPWWKGARAPRAGAGGEAPSSSESLAGELLELAGTSREGSSLPGQRAHFRELTRALAGDLPGQPVKVLEVGFNAGLGAAAFLEASPQVHVVSLDLAEHPHVVACARHLRSRFPDRFHLVMGDSRETLPRFASAGGAGFDLVLVDGGHDRATFRADLLGARAIAGAGTTVIVDDLMPHKAYGEGVWEEWNELVGAAVLTAPEIWCLPLGGTGTARRDEGDPPEASERRWGVARFV